MQSSEQQRRLELIEDGRAHVEAVRMVAPSCVMPSADVPSCLSGLVEHEVMLQGRWLRVGESVVGARNNTEVLLSAQLRVMGSTCGSSRETMQLLRVFR